MPLTPEERRQRSREASRRYKERHKAETTQKHTEWAARNREHLRAYRRAYYAANAERVCALQNAWHHSPIGQAYAQRYRQENAEKIRQDAHDRHMANQAAFNARSLAYRASHLEEMRAKDLAYHKAHPEVRKNANLAYKARRNGAAMDDFSVAQWAEVLAAKDYRCDYCGRKAKKLTRDHVTPISKQGDHTLWNIVVACSSCNSKKGNRPPIRPVQPLLLTIAPRRRMYKRRKKE